MSEKTCEINDIQCRGRIVMGKCIYHYQKAKYNTGKQRKFSKAEIEKIIKLYKSGMTAQKVSEIMDCSRQGVSKIIHKNGLTRTHMERDCQKGKKMPPEYSIYLSKRMTGKKMSLETRMKMSAAHQKRLEGYIRKEPENQIIRKSLRYKLWREAVFTRDEYTCQFCGKIGGDMQADHIKPFALFPELRFDTDNGRTLCKPCHRKTPTYGASGKRLREMFV